MDISGTGIAFKPYAQPKITPAILWTVDSAGYWHGSDRGAAQDVYESTVTYNRIESNIDSLQQRLQSTREGCTLSSFTATGQEIFGPEVSYAGSISATYIDFGTVNHVHFNKIAETQIVFRAISPTLLGTTPSLSSLRLNEGWEGGQEWNVSRMFSLDQTAYYADHQNSLGKMVGEFTANPTEAKAIIAYLLVTARANTIVLPTFSGVTYPFGYNRGSGPFNVKIPKWEIRRKDLNRWVFKIEFREAP